MVRVVRAAEKIAISEPSSATDAMNAAILHRIAVRSLTMIGPLGNFLVMLKLLLIHIQKVMNGPFRLSCLGRA